MKKETYRYLQILSYNDIKFYPDFVKMINDSNEFKVSHFLFVTWHKEVYDSINKYSNVLYLKNKKKLFKYLLKSKWIFMHANCFSKLEIILMPKKICRKIIWRTWGHDIRPIDNEKNIIKRILLKIYVKKINFFKAIGIANDVDEVNVRNVFGDKIETFLLNYRYKNNEKVYDAETEIQNDKKNEIRILLGHNAGKAENHIENLHRLSKFANENVKIILPISYSNDDIEYVDLIKKTAIKLFGEKKVVFLEEFLERTEYEKMISNCDIAIMDQEFSNGLGNLSLLIFYRKKVFVNRLGNIAQSFKCKNIEPNYTDLIEKMSFEEFKRNNFDEKMYEYINKTVLVDANANINNLKKILEILNI